MSIWAEVKKALNSTIGTSNFKPLNELYLDSRYMYASDNTIVHTIATSGSDGLFLTKIKINIPGSYRIKAFVDGVVHYVLKSTIYVEKNGIVIASSPTLTVATGSDTSGVTSCDFTANSGDIINVKVLTYEGSGGNPRYGYGRNREICGTIGVGGVPAEIYTE